jgi:hypothetical protein
MRASLSRASRLRLAVLLRPRVSRRARSSELVQPLILAAQDAAAPPLKQRSFFVGAERKEDAIA